MAIDYRKPSIVVLVHDLAGYRVKVNLIGSIGIGLPLVTNSDNENNLSRQKRLYLLPLMQQHSHR
jgi:hypothetical protein